MEAIIFDVDGTLWDAKDEIDLEDDLFRVKLTFRCKE